MADFLMARFDVYANPGARAAATPFLLDVQSDLLDSLESRVVIPLRDLAAFPQVALSERLTPVLSVDGRALMLETPKMAAVPRRALGAPLLSLAAEQARVTAAMDFVFRGF
jgi:toxin CcdB